MTLKAILGLSVGVGGLIIALFRGLSTWSIREARLGTRGLLDQPTGFQGGEDAVSYGSHDFGGEGHHGRRRYLYERSVRLGEGDVVNLAGLLLPDDWDYTAHMKSSSALGVCATAQKAAARAACCCCVVQES